VIAWPLRQPALVATVPTAPRWGCHNRPFELDCQYSTSEAGRVDARCDGCIRRRFAPAAGVYAGDGNMRGIFSTVP
jgi:hypothetical protein